MTREAIALNNKVYRRLEQFKLEFMYRGRSTKVTFDEMIKALLNDCKEGGNNA